MSTAPQTDTYPPVLPAQPNPQPLTPSDDEDLWAAYQARIWQQIAARRPAGIHIPGSALIRFTLTPTGKLVSSEIARKSGNAMLDVIALRTLRNAAPFPAPPNSMQQNQSLVFTISFSFD